MTLAAATMGSDVSGRQFLPFCGMGVARKAEVGMTGKEAENFLPSVNQMPSRS